MIKWFKQIADPEYDRIKNWIIDAQFSKSLLIITWDCYSRCSVPYSTQNSCNPLEFYLQTTSGKQQEYLYQIHDFRDQGQHELTR